MNKSAGSLFHSLKKNTRKGHFLFLSLNIVWPSWCYWTALLSYSSRYFLLLLNPIPIFLSCSLYSCKKSTWKQHFSDFFASWVLVASVNGKAFAKTGWREKKKTKKPQKSFFLFLVLALKQWETEGKYCFLYKQQQANRRWLEIPATSKGSTSSWLLLGCSNNGPTAVGVQAVSSSRTPKRSPFSFSSASNTLATNFLH